MQPIISRFYCLSGDTSIMAEPPPDSSLDYVCCPQTVILFLVNDDDSFVALRLLPRPALVLESLSRHKYYSNLSLEDSWFKNEIISCCNQKPKDPEDVHIEKIPEDLDLWKGDPIIATILACRGED